MCGKTSLGLRVQDLGIRLHNSKETGNCDSLLGLYWDTGKKMETTIVYWGYIRIFIRALENWRDLS